mgnify:CR=1 FL=1
MMIDTQITRPAVRHHPEMSYICLRSKHVSRTKSLGRRREFFPGIPQILEGSHHGINAILQHGETTLNRYQCDTPTRLYRYPADTHLIKSQDDVCSRPHADKRAPKRARIGGVSATDNPTCSDAIAIAALERYGQRQRSSFNSLNLVDVSPSGAKPQSVARARAGCRRRSLETRRVQIAKEKKAPAKILNLNFVRSELPS